MRAGRGRDAHGEAVEAALELGDHEPERLRRAGGRRDEVDRGRAGAAQVLVRTVEQVLVGGVGVDGRHLAVADADGLVEHLATGARQLVVHEALVMMWWTRRVVDLVEVHAEDDVGVDGSEPLLGAERMTLRAPASSVPLGVGAGAEAPGGLDDDVDAEVGRRQVGGVALAETRISWPSKAMNVAVAATWVREPPVDGVVREQMGEGRGVGDVVDGDDLEIGASLVGRAHEAAPDAAEAVDGDAGGHGGSLVRRRYKRTYGAAPRPPSAVPAHTHSVALRAADDAAHRWSARRAPRLERDERTPMTVSWFVIWLIANNVGGHEPLVIDPVNAWPRR